MSTMSILVFLIFATNGFFANWSIGDPNTQGGPQGGGQVISSTACANNPGNSGSGGNGGNGGH